MSFSRSKSIIIFNFENLGLINDRMISDLGHEVDALGHAGEEGRRRPRKNPVSCQTSVDPDVSEWGNPVRVVSHDPDLE